MTEKSVDVFELITDTMTTASEDMEPGGFGMSGPVGMCRVIRQGRPMYGQVRVAMLIAIDELLDDHVHIHEEHGDTPEELRDELKRQLQREGLFGPWEAEYLADDVADRLEDWKDYHDTEEVDAGE